MKKKYEHSKIWYVLNYRYYSVRIFCAWFFGMLIATVIFSDTLYNFMYCTKFGVILSLLISFRRLRNAKSRINTAFFCC